MSFDKDVYELQNNPLANPSFKLKPFIQTYELSVPDLKHLIGEKLGVSLDRITITPRKLDDASGFNGLTITVKNV